MRHGWLLDAAACACGAITAGAAGVALAAHILRDRAAELGAIGISAAGGLMFLGCAVIAYAYARAEREACRR